MVGQSTLSPYQDSQRKDEVSKLGLLFLDPAHTMSVGKQILPILPEVFGWITCQIGSITENNFHPSGHSAFCFALSKLIAFDKNLLKLAMNYFMNAPPPFHSLLMKTETHAENEIFQNVYQVSEKETLQATLHIAQCLFSDKFSYQWDWTPIAAYLSNLDFELKWLSCNILGTVSKMSGCEFQKFLDQNFCASEKNELSMRYGMKQSFEGAISKVVTTENKYSVRIGRLLLPCSTFSKNQSKGILVDLPSTTKNLEAIALSMSTNKPVLLEGVVGSGKTCYVEHLANLTGRISAPSLTKVQLGGQTDGKSLIGTYRCTENPGEFIWLPGSVTRAVTEGHWLLLEDIDCAPMDVVSLLYPLLESRILPVPGKGDLEAHTEFQLFATRRILAQGQRTSSKSMAVVEKLFSKVLLDTLATTELVSLISTKFPILAPISEKLVEVYMILSSGQHGNDFQLAECTQCASVKLTSAKTSGRLVSVRDLMKWCNRVALHASKKNLSEKACYEAIDCFCAAIGDERLRRESANHIGAHLNMTAAGITWFFNCRPEIHETPQTFSVGRSLKIPCKETILLSQAKISKALFSKTLLSTRLLEKVTVAVSYNEAVLIVGETGTGKTSIVQYLSQKTNNTLKVINMNQQSDSSDLLGGFKPVEMSIIMSPLRTKFETLFKKSYKEERNIKFLNRIANAFTDQKFDLLLEVMRVTVEKALKRNKEDTQLVRNWNKFSADLLNVTHRVKKAQSALAFSFIEGTLANAMIKGHWVLLDEINLASADTLECLSGLLESTTGSITLHERGDKVPIPRHKNFKLFACMNPATDIGKKDLPAGLRNRFTEFYMDEFKLESDLKQLVYDYLQQVNASPELIDGIVKFYCTVRAESIELSDGTGKKPHFSLRTLCRALSVARENPCRNLNRSLYEAFCLSFLTQLDRKSRSVMTNLIKALLFGVDHKKLGLGHPLPPPKKQNYIKVEKYWLSQGSVQPHKPEKYIMTETVKANLEDIARVVSLGKFPILLQGDTSVGKTSLITYLAACTGNRCVRINNHQHTDLQEYVGSYAPDESGKLVFKEGVLVQAMRNGHWIILDELNLAPTDVLEALNRLLDDNRELFIPEIDTTVEAHPNFMLFATQNPPGQYGGRQVLSRAFRNRFVELHFDLIPPEELQDILHRRCEVPPSYAKKMVAVLTELQRMRRESNALQGNQSFITLRDLFRWAERYRLAPKQASNYYDWDQHMVDEGYLVLGCRVRKQNEEEAILKALQKHMKKDIDYNRLFTLGPQTSSVTAPILRLITSIEGFEHIEWTRDMTRLFVLVSKALSFQEPVLLVGETGCGKTSVCQLIAGLNKQNLSIVNCHLHTEGVDFLGGLRPVRARAENDDRLFEWVDGPLVVSMKTGGFFLIDEISLADDSVLERLNSVLEPERTLFLAEKGSSGQGNFGSTESVVAHNDFKLVGTMNPGGDFGKKELSPALRNRFTEIWCPAIEIHEDAEDVLKIVEHNVRPGLVLTNKMGDSGIGRLMLAFLSYLRKSEIGKKCVLTIRDLLSWTFFINKVTAESNIPVCEAYIHGACLVIIDSLGSGSTSSATVDWNDLRCKYINLLHSQVKALGFDTDLATVLASQRSSFFEISTTDTEFGISPFFIKKSGSHYATESQGFSFDAPRTSLNLMRLLRGLQLSRPLLLEGSPGVGKTSIAVALAKATGHQIVRINLSEQTDVSDLFGADLPAEGEVGGHFAWRDGPLLQALKDGSWIVLDELNLASQQVLEGLNACFDHRGEIYVSELNRIFKVKQETKIFACQNPYHQGGNRKGLPKSFVNRFTQVYMDPFSSDDMEFILRSMYSEIPEKIIRLMIEFNRVLLESISKGEWGKFGGPWEFNLRDLFRWCKIMIKNQRHPNYNPGEFVNLIYADRMRNNDDKEAIFQIYGEVFPTDLELYESTGKFFLTPENVQFGHAILARKTNGDQAIKPAPNSLFILKSQTRTLESLVNCVNMNWMSILIGPSGKGKTSCVQLLSILAGKRLQTLSVNSEMDVTELLGGFEQADYGRHMQELLEDTKHHLLTYYRQELLSGDAVQPAKLIKDLQKIYNKKESHRQRTSSGEAIHLSNLFQDLRVLLLSLNKFYPQDLSPLIEKCASLSARVASSKQVIGSGTFEWIDSALVKALRNGDWLIIDGANFCSASVLDRLNALLEPRGVLTLSERGVINGSIPSLAPHPEFRLFLAMDAVNGEISRAMRNRGIEIYVDGDWKVPLDVQSFMLSQNLSSVPMQNATYKLHTKICDELPGYLRPSVSTMMQAAGMAQELCQCGVSSDQALKEAFSLAYSGSSYGESHLTGIKTIIEGATQILKKENKKMHTNLIPLVVDCHKLTTNSNDYFTEQLCSWLQIISSKQKHVERLEPLGINLDLPQNIKFIQRAVFTCLTALPLNQWEKLAVLLDQRLLESSRKVVSSLIRKAIDEIPPAFKTLGAAHISADPRYNIVACQSSGRSMNEITSLANKASVFLWHKFTDREENMKVEKSRKLKMSAMSLLQHSLAAQRQEVGGGALLHQCVAYFAPFFEGIHQVLNRICADSSFAMDDSFHFEVIRGLQWSDALKMEINKTVDKNSYHTVHPKIVFYWKQLVKFLISKVPSGFSVSFDDAVKGMKASLEVECSPLFDIAPEAHNHLSKVDPFVQSKLFSLFDHLVNLAVLLTPDQKSYSLNSFLASDEGKFVKSRLVSLAFQLFDLNSRSHKRLEEGDSQAFSKILETNNYQQMEAFLEKKFKNEYGALDRAVHELSSLVDSTLPKYQSTIEHDFSVQVWPILDHLVYTKLITTRSAGNQFDEVLSRASYIPPNVLWSLQRSKSLPVTATYLFRISNCAGRQSKQWLCYGTNDQMEIEVQEEEEEAVIPSPTASMLSFQMISAFCTSSKDFQEIPLGTYHQREEQLDQTQSTIFHNWNYFSDTRNSIEKSFMKQTLKFTEKLIYALGKSVPDSPRSTFPDKLVRVSELSKILAQTPYFQECNELVERLSEQAFLVHENPQNVETAKLGILAGVLQIHVLSHMDSLDPAIKRDMLLSFYSSAAKDIENHNLVHQWLEILTFSHYEDDWHPHVNMNSLELAKIKQEQNILFRQVAYRAPSSVYSEIISSIKHFSQTVLSPAKMLKILDGFPIQMTKVNQCDTMLKSCDNFVNHMVGSFPSFRDTLFPILDGVCLVAENLRWLCHSMQSDCLNKLISKESHSNPSTVDSILSQVLAFPSHRKLDVVSELSHQLHQEQAIAKLLSQAEPNQHQMVTCRNLSMRSLLYKLFNSVVTEGFLRKELFAFLNERIQEIIAWIKSQEDEKLLKEEEEAASFKYKARSVAVNETEEEEAEREFQETFPDFQDHFENIDNDFYDKSKHMLSPEDDVSYKEEDIHELIRIHFTCMKLVKNTWLQPKLEGSEALPLTVTLLHLQQIGLIYKNWGPITSEAIEKYGLSAIALSNHVTKASLSESMKLTLSQRPYNIYQDSSIKETLKAAPLLTTLDKRMDELLLQWPDHPALLQVKLVIKRVLDFPVTSPLIKLIIGLETVFEKTQLWEKNAHKGVSVITNLTNIAHQILCWREIEFNSWRSCLDMLSHQIHVQSYKWWSHLYQTLMAYNSSDISEVSKTLKAFMEAACLGDFEARLDLLRMFHCHLSFLLETCENSGRPALNQLVSTTWNLHQYYNQFLLSMNESLKQQKTPIEKKLKEYLKTCSFKSSTNNVVNFFAVKENIVKSRRALHRYMRKWKKVLLQPASSFLTDSGAFDIKERQEDSLNFPGILIDKTRVIVPDGYWDSLSSLPKMSSKCGNLIKKTVRNMPYQTTVDALEELTSEIASSFQKLALDAARADNLTEKEERVKQVKGVIHRKREGLSLLMKNLQSIGASYLRGNSLWKDTDLAKFLMMSPMNLFDMGESPNGTYLSQIWPSCNQYYYKCIGRYSYLRKTIAHPHADLNTDLIKRVTGYASHLMVFVNDTKKYLPEFRDALSSVKFIRNEIELASKGLYMNADEHVKWWLELSSFVTSFKITLKEYDICLSSCVTGTPLLELCSPSFDLGKVEAAREALSTVFTQLDQIASLFHIHACRTDLEKLVTLPSKKNIDDLTLVFKTLDNCMLKAKCFDQELGLSESSTLTEALDSINTIWNSISLRFKEWEDSIEAHTTSHLDPVNISQKKNFDQTLKAIFLAVQRLYKSHEFVENNEDSVADNYLADSIKKFHMDFESLNIIGINSHLIKLCHQIQTTQTLWNFQILQQLLVIVQNFFSLSESVFVSMVGTFRSLTKLQSVLLSIFSQLAGKGFCRPSDIKEGGAGEGKMSFEDSGMGLAEGEGKKDVSDRFDTEDQLDSALQKGEEENTADDDVAEEKGGVEMSEDFDGKMQDVNQEDDEDGNEEEKDQGDDFDKQMGDVDKGQDTLDEKLWDNDDDEPDEGEQKSTEEGAGGEATTESEMVAKEDDIPDEKSKKKDKLETMEEDPREQNEENEEEDYGDDFTDDFQKKPDESNQEETLPDMMSLDNMEEKEDEKSDSELDSTIPQKPLFPEDEMSSQNEQDAQDDKENESDLDKDEEMQDQSNDIDNDDDVTNPDLETKMAEELEDKNEVSDAEEDAPRTANNNTQIAECEAADDGQKSSSKDNTKEQSSNEKGGDEREEEHQEDHGESAESAVDKTGVGKSDSKSKQDSHEGDTSQLTSQQEMDDGKQTDRNQHKPGDVNENRTVGNNAEKIRRGLVSKDISENTKNDENADQESELYEHVADADKKIDNQIVDAGTQDQAQAQPAPKHSEESDHEEMQGITDELHEEEPKTEEMTDPDQIESDSSGKDSSKNKSGQKLSKEKDDENKCVTEGDVVMEMTVERPTENNFFTQITEEGAMNIFGGSMEDAMEPLEICDDGDVGMGEETWNEVQAAISPVAQQLCELLRLILEPTQASKLKGDFRIGKRLNMRKVILYIASGFQKDKIWLRRTQPNKRNYQVMIAVDDSKSMNEINATNLARQGVALVGSALELLEVGSIGVVSFGSSTKVLHKLGDPFSHNAGIRVMSNLRFDQRETNFVKMLKDCTTLLTSACGSGSQDTVQLLLILSDGQNRAGSKAVKAAVQAARSSRIFVVFLVLDAQNDSKYSFYDTLVWDNGKMNSIMDTFPFPYFLVVRDMATLPEVLSSALRQWFELVSSGVY